MNAKVKVARLSIVSNTFLIILKIVVGLLSGSVSIISEAIHSSMDLIAALIAFFSVKVSDNPPDSRHPYGHGKVENISGVIEAILIFIAAIWIITEAVKKLLCEEIVLDVIWLGSSVMLISAIVNTLVSRKLYKVARETKSVALEADALHLKTDVYTSAGVAVGLGLIFITGIKWLDPFVAILVALFIIKESYSLLRRAFTPLLDTAWGEDEIEDLERRLNQMEVNYHDLRTRVAGNYRFVDIHVEIPEDESVGNAHSYCDMIEDKLNSLYDNITVTIHVEPQLKR
ncbi:MAG: cation diffusion facilitator family transporter [Bacteroidales bacterium]|jgi:cation diffusion facilitator family transporter|nr:cation diffusion facilitator family transporter [Bacteroidales bacterium]NMD01846.1 cation transporter [Bacteroidales bacterium]OQB61067.1 MAG: Ferrous-iron efflux pump FieF [Bacteroidetes bacterium ADurb.Bin145]HOU02997.1 cation diffusion facilitator family transporter [Bacteroidales bacterium]HQK68465.1 cation diffusion facilitator family transporter [Bacteroidales bacterium]